MECLWREGVQSQYGCTQTHVRSWFDGVRPKGSSQPERCTSDELTSKILHAGIFSKQTKRRVLLALRIKLILQRPWNITCSVNFLHFVLLAAAPFFSSKRLIHQESEITRRPAPPIKINTHKHTVISTCTITESQLSSSKVVFFFSYRIWCVLGGLCALGPSLCVQGAVHLQQLRRSWQ